MKASFRNRAVVGVAALVATASLGFNVAAGASLGQTGSGARWSGRAAITKLGASLPGVAAEHGISAAELRSEFLSDSSLFVDDTGGLLFVDPAAPDAAPAGSDAVFDPSIADADALLLHSRPGAQRVIYLDFDGQTLSGTAWNGSTGGDCYADPYDSNGVPGSFSNTELGVIKSVWKRMAEDYAPFDVDVTTADPGYAAINRSSTSDSTFGTRLLITNSQTACPNGKTLYQSVCSSGCGGVAYVGVYDNTGSSHDYYQPALVFQNGVGSGAKYIAEAGSHEVGHNGGLSHDGTATTGYYQGHGDWAPIMGVGYYEPITQWSKGQYSGANQLQDDFVVAASNGLSIRTDDHGNTAATATVLSGSSFAADGVITTATDIDVFAFTASAGPATIAVDPAPTSPDLDIRLDIRNTGGELVASIDPASAALNGDIATGMNASTNVTFTTSGTYTLTVDGVGKGDPLTTGYSDYGSVGHYRVSGTVTGTDGLPPVAVAVATPTSGAAPLAVSFDGSGSSDPEGGALSFLWDFGDGSAPATEVNPSHSYTTAGTYTATLTVTDATGFTDTDSVTITATAPVRLIDVYTMGLSATRSKQGVSATASITVRDAANTAVGGATVTGTWKIGTKTGATKSATTSASGIATISSGTLKVTSGTALQFCVTGLTLSGATWSQSLFLPATTTDCVTVNAP